MPNDWLKPIEDMFEQYGQPSWDIPEQQTPQVPMLDFGVPQQNKPSLQPAQKTQKQKPTMGNDKGLSGVAKSYNWNSGVPGSRAYNTNVAKNWSQSTPAWQKAAVAMNKNKQGAVAWNKYNNPLRRAFEAAQLSITTKNAYLAYNATENLLDKKTETPATPPQNLPAEWSWGGGGGYKQKKYAEPLPVWSGE